MAEPNNLKPAWRVEGSMSGLTALLPLDDAERALVGETVPVEEAEVAIVESFSDLPLGTWARARRLRWVVSVAAGAEHVPFRELPAGVRVVSLHGPNADAIAEHAVALLLAAFRRVVASDRALRAGGFPQDAAGLRRVAGARLLVLGAGAIGSRVARLGEALGMRARVWRRGEDIDAELGKADAVVVALPLTRETRGLLDARRLAFLREDAVLVNVARGRIVDHDALLARLREAPRMTLATDVWWRYPREGAAMEDALLALPNVIGTPHVAAMHEGWREERVAAAARVARALLATGNPPAGSKLEDPTDYLA